LQGAASALLDAGADVSTLQPMADDILRTLLGLGQIEFAVSLVEAGLHMSTGGLQPLLEAAAEASKDKAQRTIVKRRFKAAWQKRKPCSCGVCTASGPASTSATALRGPSSSAIPAATSGPVPAAPLKFMLHHFSDDGIPQYKQVACNVQPKQAAVRESTQDAAALEAAAAANAMAAKLIAEEKEAAAKKQAKQEGAAAAAKAAKQKRQGEHKKQQQQAGKQQLKGGQLQHSTKLDCKGSAAASLPPLAAGVVPASAAGAEHLIAASSSSAVHLTGTGAAGLTSLGSTLLSDHAQHTPTI